MFLSLKNKFKNLLPFLLNTVIVLAIFYYNSKKEVTVFLEVGTILSMKFEVKNSSSSKWLILKSDGANICNLYADVMNNWTILCLTDDDKFEKLNDNEMRLKLNSVDELKKELSPNGLNIEYIVYFLAIKNGAKTIYSIDLKKVSNHKEHLNSIVKFNPDISTGLLYNDKIKNIKRPFNSSIYFGCYSTDEYDDINDTHRFPLHCYDGILPAIYTPAYFESSRLEIERCDRKMPDIALWENNFVHLEIDKTIFSTCSFLFLPVFKPILKDPSKDGDIVYKCFVQWAVWQFKCYISVYWENYLTFCKLNSNHASECIKTVQNFPDCKLKKPSSVQECVLEVFRSLFTNETYVNLKTWVDILKNANLNPNYNINLTGNCDVNSSTVLHPVRQKRDIHLATQYEITNVQISQKYYEKTCTKNITKDIKLENLSAPRIQQAKVLLLVVFNHPHYEIIPFLEVMYRPLYPYMLYCGHMPPKFNDTFPYRISFITYNQMPGQNAGSLNFQCILKVIRMGYDLEGIFAVADDVFIKTELTNISTSKNWLVISKDRVVDLNLMKRCTSTTNCTTPLSWIWWEGYKPNILRAFGNWTALAQNDRDLKAAKDRLTNVTGGETRAIGNTGDICFVSRKYYSVVYKLFHLFMKEQIFLEISIPTVLRSVTEDGDLFALEGHMEWGGNRDKPWAFVRNSSMYLNHFAHPVKLSIFLKKTESGLKMFCNCVMKYYHDTNRRLCSTI